MFGVYVMYFLCAEVEQLQVYAVHFKYIAVY